MKKVGLLFLILIIGLSALTSCGNSNKEKESVNLSELEAKYIGSQEPINLMVDGAANYVVVRDKESPSVVTMAAGSVIKTLRTAFNVSFVHNQDTKEEIPNEILVGETNRKESGYGKELLLAKGGRADDFLVAVMGTKIVICGMTEEATKAACDYFNQNIAKQSSVDQKLCYYDVGDTNEFKEIKIGDTTKHLNIQLVRPRYNVGHFEQEALEELSETFYKTTGYKLAIVKDQLSTPVDYEIIFGETTREGEEAVSDYDTYTINPVGNKIYINGGHTYSRAAAVKELTKHILEGKSVSEKITGSYAKASALYDDSYYKLTWTDEFDATALNTSMWILTDITSENKRAKLRDDGMMSYRMAENVYLKDGKLYHVATYDDNAYYGTYMVNHGNMCYKYGYTEASMVIPYGVGLWTSFWLTNDERDFKPKGNYSNEINIMECTGGNTYAVNMHRHPTENGKAAGVYHTSMDWHYKNGEKVARLDEDEYYYKDFHTVGYMWYKDKADFYLDGEKFFSYTYGEKDELEDDLDSFDEPLSMKITMAVGFQDFPIKGASYWQDSNKFIVDYVHVYQDVTGLLKVY